MNKNENFVRGREKSDRGREVGLEGGGKWVERGREVGIGYPPCPPPQISVSYIEFTTKFLVKVSSVMYISVTTYQKAFIF